MSIAAAWIVSAWPGLLVEWDGLAVAAGPGLGVLAGFVAWQVVVHGARVGQPEAAGWDTAGGLLVPDGERRADGTSPSRSSLMLRPGRCQASAGWWRPGCSTGRRP